MDERVLVLAPRGRDAQVVAQLLSERRQTAIICSNMDGLIEELVAGADTALVTEEALFDADLTSLSEWLRDQPPWSDFPFVLLAARRPGSSSNVNVQSLVESLGNVVMLERPISAQTLASAVDSALRARRRQYQTAQHLHAIEQADSRLRLALSAGRLGSWELDLGGWQLAASSACKENFGRKGDEPFAYDDLLAAIHPEDRERHLESVRLAITQRIDLDIEYRNVWPDGSEHWIEVRGRTIYDEAGDPQRMTGVSVDVTDRHRSQRELLASQRALKQFNETLESRIEERTRDLAHANDRLVKEIAERERMQAALVQAQKMEAIGQLTNGIAHDFNNLLTAIVGNVDLISRRTTDERLARFANYAREAATRATRLTGQLLAFSRTQRLDLQPVSLDELLEGMSDLIRRSIGPSIKVQLQLQAGSIPAIADANQLELAILNLVINARDAMPEGGALTLATAVRRASGSDLASGEYVVVSLTDTGTGIPAPLLARVFEPFFTTKPVGKGTGLGLSQVYGIAQQSGGTVRIRSQDRGDDHGTTVEIWLPVSDVPLAAQLRYAGEDSLVNIAHGESILVVEDDRDVRQFISECLHTFGYEVRESEDGYAGIDALNSRCPDLLIVDFAMPGINGAEVATRAREQHADLPIIFVTGYADMDAVERVSGSKFLLRKPFEVAALANVVRHALSEQVRH
jgi:PAS domain S-box-containing protein